MSNNKILTPVLRQASDVNKKKLFIQSLHNVHSLLCLISHDEIQKFMLQIFLVPYKQVKIYLHVVYQWH